MKIFKTIIVGLALSSSFAMEDINFIADELKTRSSIVVSRIDAEFSEISDINQLKTLATHYKNLCMGIAPEPEVLTQFENRYTQFIAGLTEKATKEFFDNKEDERAFFRYQSECRSKGIGGATTLKVKENIIARALKEKIDMLVETIHEQKGNIFESWYPQYPTIARELKLQLAIEKEVKDRMSSKVEAQNQTTALMNQARLNSAHASNVEAYMRHQMLNGKKK